MKDYQPPRQMQEILDRVVKGISGDRANYFNELTQRMCEVSGAEFGMVGRISGNRIETVSAFSEGAHVENFSCPLTGTPCEDLFVRDSCVVQAEAWRKFPADHMLETMRGEGYVGTRLVDEQGVPIGMISLATREPLDDPRFIAALQAILAVPAGLELERRREIERASDLEQSLASILSIAEEAIIATDADFRIVLFNEGARNVFGYEPDEILGEHINMLLPQAMRQRHRSLMTDFVSGEEVSRLMNQRASTLVGLRKNGTEFPAEASITRNGTGTCRTITVVLRDITERKRSEVALQYAQRMKTLGNMAAGLAHDFNNILTLIRGSIELSMMQPADDNMGKQLEVALKEIDRGADLVSRLLHIGKAHPQEPMVVNPVLLVDQLLDMLKLSIGEAVETTLFRDDECWNVHIDASQLENALVNLVLNARDAMDANGSLEIILRNAVVQDAALTKEMGIDPGDYVCIGVQDNGRGMDSETMAKAVEPFFSTRRDNGGTGLGLSMVQGFAHNAGGGLLIRSTENVGTLIELYLPRAATSLSTGTDHQELLMARHDEAILVVEDHPQIRELAVVYAQGLGYNVLEATTGQEAINLLEASSPVDLVFTDFQLPGGINGEEVARHAHNKGIKTIITSGYGEAGPDPANYTLLPKPYSCHALAAAIRRTLDTPDATARATSPV